jgi:leader peptidase (prepilin peptidase)/N-methyltransferase
MIFFVFCCALLAVFWIDLEHLIIPDVISLTGIAIGVMSCITGLVPEMDWKFSLLGTVLGGAALYIPAWLYEKVRGLEGLGGGDVKLLAMIGSFTGPYGVVFVLFFGSLMGSLCVLLGIALRGVESKTPIPFAPFLTSASVAYVFVGKLIIDRLYWLSASY